MNKFFISGQEIKVQTPSPIWRFVCSLVIFATVGDVLCFSFGLPPLVKVLWSISPFLAGGWGVLWVAVFLQVVMNLGKFMKN